MDVPAMLQVAYARIAARSTASFLQFGYRPMCCLQQHINTLLVVYIDNFCNKYHIAGGSCVHRRVCGAIVDYFLLQISTPNGTLGAGATPRHT